MRALLGVLQPGDILLRAYTNYLDGKFIPGRFSHAALYCGALRDEDRTRVLFLKRQAIPPDDFLNDRRQRVWASASVRSRYPDLRFPPVSG